MIRHALAFIVAALMASNLAACNFAAPGQGPAVWIDQPLDGDHVPLGPLTFQAHASDADGIGTIEFYASETLLQAVPVDSQRMGNAAIEWNPPAPGDYTISARAADSQGNLGPSASAHIVVDGLVDLAATAGPAQTDTGTPTPAAVQAAASGTPTPAPASSGPMFEATQDGNCREGPGTAYRALAVLMQGQETSIEGRNPDANWFWVVGPSGSGHCWVSAAVGTPKGNWQVVPIVEAPVLPITATPTPADLTPPSITDVSINPTTVQKAGCGGQETFTISATVTDASGIANVTYEITGPGPLDAGDGYLIPAGGDYDQPYFSAVVGPMSGTTGSWSIVVHARDMAQNDAQAGPWTIQLVCIQ
jgi:hypothetical protein